MSRLARKTRPLFRSALLASTAMCSLGVPAALADTRTASISGAALEATWSDCPANPSVTTDCNYTGIYASKEGSASPYFIIQMSRIRVYYDGSIQILASAAGVDQPADSFSVARDTLASGRGAGTVYLYGDCGNPSDISTCYYYGTAGVSVSLRQVGGTSTWKQSSQVASPDGWQYTVKNNGAARPAQPSGTAVYNGGSWTLGTYISSRLTRFYNTQTLVCPTTCPSSAAPPPAAAAAPLPSGEGQETQAGGSWPKVPPPQVSVDALRSRSGEDPAGIAAGRADLLDPSFRTSNGAR